MIAARLARARRGARAGRGPRCRPRRRAPAGRPPVAGAIAHARFAELPELLRPGRPARDQHLRHAAGGDAGARHRAARCTCRRPRRAAATAPGWSSCARPRDRFDGGAEGDVLAAARRRATAVLLERDPGGRLWLAGLRPAGARCRTTSPVTASRSATGTPPREWPLERYQTVYANAPGSAEMPSAGRAFTPELVTQLVAAGIDVAPLVLHTGVSSLEAGERPHAEWYGVPRFTAERVKLARALGGRVIAVGTTVVRALESAPARTAASASRGLDRPRDRARRRRSRRSTACCRASTTATRRTWRCSRRSPGRDLLERSYEEADRGRLPAPRVRRPAPDPAASAGACP